MSEYKLDDATLGRMIVALHKHGVKFTSQVMLNDVAAALWDVAPQPAQGQEPFGWVVYNNLSPAKEPNFYGRKEADSIPALASQMYRELPVYRIVPVIDLPAHPQPAAQEREKDATLRNALAEVRSWFEAERKSISKGNGSQWAMWQCDEQMELIDAAISAQSAGGKA